MRFFYRPVTLKRAINQLHDEETEVRKSSVVFKVNFQIIAPIETQAGFLY